MNRRAKEMFGTTEVYERAGHITQDGEMLDFGSENDEELYLRTYDHAWIVMIDPDSSLRRLSDWELDRLGNWFEGWSSTDIGKSFKDFSELQEEANALRMDSGIIRCHYQIGRGTGKTYVDTQILRMPTEQQFNTIRRMTEHALKSENRVAFSADLSFGSVYENIDSRMDIGNAMRKLRTACENQYDAIKTESTSSGLAGTVMMAIGAIALLFSITPRRGLE